MTYRKFSDRGAPEWVGVFVEVTRLRSLSMHRRNKLNEFVKNTISCELQEAREDTASALQGTEIEPVLWNVVTLKW
ncbi:MAG TPA: hypothetical protein VG759_12045 [Candidatus Angelobacter sp.]|nr:hypothetical protein [Candidatus Angelobacter sp.]